jgi:PAS domain S-box-containing protein
MLATVLSIFAVEDYLTPALFPERISLSEVPNFVVFFLTGALISWLAHRQRRDEEALLRAGEGLEEKVRERTADLQKAYEKLTAEVAERARAAKELPGINRVWRVRTKLTAEVIERKRAEALLSGEKRLLEMIATGVRLKEILNALCSIIEEQRSDTLASVLLLNPDGIHLDVAAAPNLPNEWTQQMEKLPIGPCAGSCGTAAYRGSPVIVCDIATDALWEVPEHRASALKHRLRASWSVPVLSSKGEVLGTFCMYHREPRSPNAQDLELIELAGHLARVAIERDRAEKALRASEKKYRELIDAAPDAIFVWDARGKCVLCNASAARLRGCSAEEMIGLSLSDTYVPAERDLLQKRFDQVKKQGVLRYERQFLRKNNEIVPAEVSFSTTGEDQYQTVLRDVSDRKRAEEILRERASLLDLTHDIVFVRNMNDVITYWNRGAEELYGWTRQEAVGQVSHQLTRTIFSETLDDVNAKLLRTGRWEGELIHTARDGAAVVVASRWSLQRDERGNPSAILETNNDITERKKAEEALRRSYDKLEMKVKERTAELHKMNDELQSVNKELEAFAYSVSHDLRAPIRHIAGFTELLQKHADPVLDDKSRRHISTILEAANRMGSLVDDLLAFSRIGRAETLKTTINLEELVNEVVGEIEPDTQGRRICWRIGKLPICYGDPSMLRLVVGNLVSNAVKFTRTRPQAEIEIGSLNHRADEAIVFIKDNGVGFDMKYEDKLFGVFQRLHSQEAFGGTGIGLATVQRIVHRHGGRVWGEGSVNKGATFYVALPKPAEVNP